MKKKILVSLVIHNQSVLVEPLIDQLLSIESKYLIEIVLRVNTREDVSNLYRFIGYPNFMVVFNINPLGFGANHNLNFSSVACDYFVVMNPDIDLVNGNFDSLIDIFDCEKVGIVSPKVVNSENTLEDSIREFPTVSALFRRYSRKQEIELERLNLVKNGSFWCAGMFMIFSSESYRIADGFDKKYFMYLEDADICLRLKYIFKKQVIYDPSYKCIHNAQRASRSFSIAFLWHLSSLIKFQFTYFYLKILGVKK